MWQSLFILFDINILTLYLVGEDNNTTQRVKSMESGIGGQLRSVVSLIDRLRDIQLQQYIKLPKICVLGSQSSGKSSLIEQIVGLDFLPRGTGVVTRRPLEIRMTYDQQTSQPIASFEEIPGKTFTNFSDVKSSIEQLTDQVCGTSKNIVDKAIVLKVQSNSCPNLTVIDLPGLTRIALDGQDKDIYKITREMITRYMSDPSTIILCVVSANQDITNDEVLHTAMKIDTLGERTLACITKIDIMDRGTDARMLLLNKGEVPLKLGYIGIKNRSQADIQQNMTVADSLKAQKMFFSTSAIYSSLPPSCLGTSALVTSLTKVLESNITQFLPELLEQVKQRKTALHDIIKEYGRPLPKGEAQEQALIWSLSSQFLAQFKKSIKGHLTSLKAKEELSKTSSHLNHIFETSLEEEYNNEPEGVTNQKVLFAITKFQGGSLPGFPSIHSFYYLIDPLIKNLKLPLEHTINQVCETVSRMADTIVREICKQFPAFCDHMQDRSNKLIEEGRKKCLSFLSHIIECQINYIFTNNPEFYQNLQQFEEKDLKDPIITKNPIVAVLRKRVLSYHKVVVKNLREVIPKNIKRTILELTIKNIQFDVFQSSHNNSQQIKEWLKPSAGDYHQRVIKEKEYDVLLKAQKYLLTHPAFSRVRVEDVKKRRTEREKKLKELQAEQSKKKAAKPVQQSPIKKEEKLQSPRDSTQKVPQQKGKVQQQPSQSEKAGFFQNIFGAGGKKQEVKKDEPKIIEKQPEVKKRTEPAEPEKKGDKNNLFNNLFGLGGAKTQKEEPQKAKDFNIKDEYNKKAGHAADRAVDETFKNQTFQKESKKAVESGTSAAIQHQLGVSEKTGNAVGKGAGWLFGQDATQNYLKDQAKTNLKHQVQKK